MSKFKPYDLEEAEQEFPLVNEETLEMLKGGCGECESWREWGVGVYTLEEYQALVADNKWTGGCVCGMGYILGESTSSGKDGYNGWHILGDGKIYCDLHSTYFEFMDGCGKCYNEQHGDDDYSSYNNNNHEPGTDEFWPGWNYGNTDSGWDNGWTGSHTPPSSPDFPVKTFETIYSSDSTLDESQKKALKNALDLIYDEPWGKEICKLLEKHKVCVKFEVGEIKDVNGIRVPAIYDADTQTIRFNTSDDIDFNRVSEEIMHSIQHKEYTSDFKNIYSNFEFEAKILVDVLSTLPNVDTQFSGDTKEKYKSFISNIEEGNYYKQDKFDETTFNNDFYNLCKDWHPQGYTGTCNDSIDPKLLLKYAQSIKK